MFRILAEHRAAHLVVGLASLLASSPVRAQAQTEVGVYGGVHVFDNSNELGIVDAPAGSAIPNFASAPTFGVRAAFRPWWFAGIEGEAGFTPTSIAENVGIGIFDAFPAKVLTLRAQVIVDFLNLDYRLRPFVLAGAGTQSVVSSGNLFAVEKDTDFVVHAGAGVRFRITDRFGLRLDGKVLMPPSARSDSFQLSVLDLEGTLGGYFTWGARPAPRVREEEPSLPPPTVIAAASPAPVPVQREVAPERVDRDGDGIEDGKDGCPDQAETVNARDDEDGCPDSVEPAPSPLNAVVLAFQFQNGSAEIPKRASVALTEVVAWILRNPGVRFEIQGHSDDTGSFAFNQALSQHRADSVRAYFVSKGVPPERLSAKGYASAKPLASNKTSEGRATNRRVEVHPLK